MRDELRERLHDYDLQALLGYAIKHRLIDGHKVRDDSLFLHIDEEIVCLDEQQALKFIHSIVRAYAIGTGEIPPVPQQP